MIDATKYDIILWQTHPDEGVAEMPIAIKCYEDVIRIEQMGESINLNYHMVNEFIRALRRAIKEHTNEG
jgi:hypothetical protein